jgi:6-phosphofructokinase 1
LGHAQQGGNPTPFDRNMGTKLAARALEHLIVQAKEYCLPTGENQAMSPDSATLLALRVCRNRNFGISEDYVSLILWGCFV